MSKYFLILFLLLVGSFAFSQEEVTNMSAAPQKKNLDYFGLSSGLGAKTYNGRFGSVSPVLDFGIRYKFRRKRFGFTFFSNIHVQKLRDEGPQSFLVYGAGLQFGGGYSPIWGSGVREVVSSSVDLGFNLNYTILRKEKNSLILGLGLIRSYNIAVNGKFTNTGFTYTNSRTREWNEVGPSFGKLGLNANVSWTHKLSEVRFLNFSLDFSNNEYTFSGIGDPTGHQIMARVGIFQRLNNFSTVEKAKRRSRRRRKKIATNGGAPLLNRVFLEIAGQAVLYSVNFERKFLKGSGDRFSGVAATAGITFTGLEVDGILPIFAVGRISYHMMRGRHSYDFGLSLTKDMAGTEHYVATFFMRYRKSFKRNPRWSWGVSLAPIQLVQEDKNDPNLTFYPIPGFDIGYAF